MTTLDTPYIVIVHREDSITRILINDQPINTDKYDTSRIFSNIRQLSEQFPTARIVWCNHLLEPYINHSYIQEYQSEIPSISSYRVGQSNAMETSLGFIDWSVFVHVNKQVKYPTWIMSSDIGFIDAAVLRQLKLPKISKNSFDYELCSLTKKHQPAGLFCYSDPNLLNEGFPITPQKWNTAHLFLFVRKHYGFAWMIVLYLLICRYKKWLNPMSLVSNVFRRKEAICPPLELPFIHHNSTITEHSIDIIIPTIGREKYLYNFLTDLKTQAKFINKVIIIEQHPDESANSNLDYLTTEKWPFAITHKFIHRTGACNARNVGLKEVTAEWVFLADDDIRIQNKFFSDFFELNERIRANAYTFCCLQPTDQKQYKYILQWTTFGSGSSMIRSNTLNELKFDTRYEFGYGEDFDFGMQLRSKGIDIVYLPFPEIQHLKAPTGGFRTQFQFPWDNAVVKPKPSPTVTLYQQRYYTKQQRLGYYFHLLLKYYNRQPIKNPINYSRLFKKMVIKSNRWGILLNRHTFEYTK